MDVVTLSRVQFALTVGFHYLFPPLTIGLGILIVIFEATWLKTGEETWHRATKFWVSLFAVTFAMGVASGIVMEFQFGTNWATYSRYVGDVFGSALAAEGIFAFFLESGFLAVLVFGWDRVGKKMHFFSTLMVSLGSIFSSIWIVVANSWQQTPAGYHLVVQPGGFTRAEVTSFWSVVFNPSTVDRLVHVWLAALVLGAFFVMSVSAFYLLRGRHEVFAKKSFKIALFVAAAASILLLVSGDSNGRMVARHQPAKLAAFEGIYHTGEGGTGMRLFGIPDDESQAVKAAITLPDLLSFLVYRDFHTPVAGLDRFPKPDHPPVAVPFFAFHLMVALGTFFIVLTLLSLWFLRKKSLFGKRWLLWIWVFAVLGAFAANELGWIATEVGRQPWIVQPKYTDVASGAVPFSEYATKADFSHIQGGLRTADAASPGVSAPTVLGSIFLFGLMYGMLFLVWVFVLNDKIQKGPVAPGKGGEEEPKRGFFAAASEMPGRKSLTEAKEPLVDTDEEE